MLGITNDAIKEREMNIKELFADVNIDNNVFDASFNLIYKIPIINIDKGNLSVGENSYRRARRH